jgi:hypothetical protein
MKLSEFIFLPEKEKIHIVFHNGILIGKRNNYDCKVFLFQVEELYVEIFCNKETKVVDEFRFFKTTNGLKPYLDEIPLEGLG